MNVKLEHYTPLWIGSDATRTCWDSGDKSDTGLVWECALCGKISAYDELFNDTEGNHECPECESTDLVSYKKAGEKDCALIDRVGNKYKHSSTLEHLNYNFHIKGISRACLQELARHRIASPSVKSTRYTLKELKNLPRFVTPDSTWQSLGYANDMDRDSFWKNVAKFLVLTGDERVDACSVIALQNLQDMLKEGISNDIAKFCLPESYKTELAWTINARSLQNFLALRTNKAALWEIRKLAYSIYKSIPDEHKFIFTDVCSIEKGTDE